MQKTKLITLISPIVFLVLSATSSASEKWSSTFSKDVNNDGKADTFVYTLEKKDINYDGSLKITDNSGKELWFHPWEMTKEDLEDDLLRESGNIKVKEWVDHFFDGTYHYGASFELFKINESEIDPDYMEFYAKKYKIEPKKLTQEILAQKKSLVFSYRASWREDLKMLVYIPSLSKFIVFSGGEY